MAAPRAWPSFSAESAFLLRNTRSTAISCGVYSAMMALTPAKMMPRRSASESPCVRMHPLAT